jgi:hypothetical protein
MAHFALVLSPAPDDEWTKLFEENVVKTGNMRSQFRNLIWLHGQRIIFFSEPDSLQVLVDTIKHVMANTNAHRVDLAGSVENVNLRRRDFEKSVNAAIEALEL